jgi:small-conductance mechanosensitive channel
MILSWTDATIQALQNLWYGFLNFIPLLIGAIIVFIIGWFIAMGVGRLITEILKKLKFNQLVERGGWKGALEKAEIKVDTSGFIGAIVKWILVIVFLLVAVEILGLVQFADFLKGVLAYLPNVIIAVLIFVVTVIVVDIVEKLARATIESIKVGYGQIVSAIVKWSIWVFAILAILHQLGIARPFMETLFTGLVAMLVISLGIAFGLGGKDVAAEILQDLKRKLKG